MKVTAINTVIARPFFDQAAMLCIGFLLLLPHSAYAQITTDADDITARDSSTNVLDRIASKTARSRRPTSDRRLPALKTLSQEATGLLTGEAKASSLSEQVDFALRIVNALATLQEDPRLPRNGKLQQVRRSLTKRLRSIQKRTAATHRRLQRRPETIEIKQSVLGQLNQAAGGRAGPANAGNANANNLAAQDYGPLLIDLIQRTISPQSWDVNGGASTIQYWRPGMALVVRAPGHVHDELAPVLGQLRK